jgi:hypothetical protein
MAFYEILIILASDGDMSNHTVVGMLLHFGKSVLIRRKYFVIQMSYFVTFSVPLTHVVDNINCKITEGD